MAPANERQARRISHPAHDRRPRLYRLIGALNEYGEPETAELQMQDWGVPWQAWGPCLVACHVA